MSMEREPTLHPGREVCRPDSWVWEQFACRTAVPERPIRRAGHD